MASYFIGDLCNVLSNKEWSQLLDITAPLKSSPVYGAITVNNKDLILLPTGDYGQFVDSDGFSYFVDTGTIGCINLDDVEPSELGGTASGRIVEFEFDIMFDYTSEYIEFTDGDAHISISLESVYEEEEEEDYNDYDEDEDNY
jgi:hypothetical protein